MSPSTPTKRPKIAVLMPARNAQRYVRWAIDSVLAQADVARLDIIVVDDGSTDGTAAIVSRFCDDGLAVRLLRQPSLGIPMARNAALRSVTPDTDFLTFLDADDLSAPSRFAIALRAFRDAPNSDVVWGMTRPFRDTGDFTDRTGPAEAGEPERGSQLGAVMMTARTWTKLGFFDETLPQGEDVDYLLRLLEMKPRLKLIPDVMVFYRRHDANVTKDRDSARAALARAYLLAAQRRRRGAPSIDAGIFHHPRPAV